MLRAGGANLCLGMYSRAIDAIMIACLGGTGQVPWVAGVRVAPRITLQTLTINSARVVETPSSDTGDDGGEEAAIPDSETEQHGAPGVCINPGLVSSTSLDLCPRNVHSSS
jgi:hypothetical protein